MISPAVPHCHCLNLNTDQSLLNIVSMADREQARAADRDDAPGENDLDRCKLHIRKKGMHGLLYQIWHHARHYMSSTFLVALS